MYILFSLAFLKCGLLFESPWNCGKDLSVMDCILFRVGGVYGKCIFFLSIGEILLSSYMRVGLEMDTFMRLKP